MHESDAHTDRKPRDAAHETRQQARIRRI